MSPSRPPLHLILLFNRDPKKIATLLCSRFYLKLLKDKLMEAIRTKRLVLRDLEEGDWKSVHDYASDHEVVRHMDWGPNTTEETRNFIRRAIAHQQEQPRRSYDLAVTLTSQNVLIGACGIYAPDPNSREGWIGYVFNRNFWGQGYATETAKALLKFGFNQLNLHRIFATCDPANIASAHVLEKIGMQHEAHFREHKMAKGRWRDSLLYAILDYEWERIKA
jgi:RimJ/RimL family protein N-acetyltransferase